MEIKLDFISNQLLVRQAMIWDIGFSIVFLVQFQQYKISDTHLISSSDNSGACITSL